MDYFVTPSTPIWWLRFTCFLLFSAVAVLGLGQAQFGVEQVISANASGATSVTAQDLDGDGDMDVISSSFNDGKIAWYENDGLGNFSSEIIVSNSAAGASDVQSQDIDGDGDMDLLSVSVDNATVAWYQNDGEGNFSDAIVISQTAFSGYRLHCQDLDGDGDFDLLAALLNQNKVVWFSNDGDGNFSDQIVITQNAELARSIHSQDLDGDGDYDVISGSGNDNKIAWYQNDGTGNFSDEIIISESALGCFSVYTADVDGDGDWDVLSATESNHQINWYENNGDGTFGTEVVITSSDDGANTVHCRDLDGDGDPDVLSASYFEDMIAWYENDGSGDFSSMNVISTQSDYAFDVHTADLDGDGVFDVLAASNLDNKIAWFEGLGGHGCTDPGACNYQPSVWLDDNTCCFENCGCIDPTATNFDPDATCPDGSCMYTLTGVVFDDLNENGNQEENEYTLPFQHVVVPLAGISMYTNNDGIFQAEIPEGSYAVYVDESENLPFNTTPNPVMLSTQDGLPQVVFGLSKEAPQYEVCVDIYPSGNGFLCNDWSNHNLWFQNKGNVPIVGVIALEIDELFQGWQEVTPIDSVNGNTVYMSFENLLPGELFIFDILLNTPTVDHIGELAVSTATVIGFDESGVEVASGMQTLETEITCAYDPNDKQAFPLGYGDDHRLLGGTEQEYLIRFQNTGNAPAQDVVIVDTLDVNFDLETFQIVANSHSMSAVINEQTREIRFQFFDIQLPDSTCCEPESHGLVSYRIKPQAGLPPETRLENTAYIFFDNNDPIVTNTTWTAIHECQEEVTLSLQEGPDCPIVSQLVSSDYITYRASRTTTTGRPPTD